MDKVAAVDAEVLEGEALAAIAGATTAAELEDARVFTLPPGYRPANVENLVSANGGDFFPAGIVIGADRDTLLEGVGTIPAGAVLVLPIADHPQGVFLDGLDFRAAGTGGF